MNIKQDGDYVVLGARDASECVDNICDSIRELMKMVDPERLVKGSTEIHIKTATQPEYKIAGREEISYNLSEFVTVAIKFIEEVPENEQQQADEQE